MDLKLMILKNLDPRGLSVPTPGQYTCIHETAWPIKAKLYVEHS